MQNAPEAGFNYEFSVSTREGKKNKLGKKRKGGGTKKSKGKEPKKPGRPLLGGLALTVCHMWGGGNPAMGRADGGRSNRKKSEKRRKDGKSEPDRGYANNHQVRPRRGKKKKVTTHARGKNDPPLQPSGGPRRRTSRPTGKKDIKGRHVILSRKKLNAP